MTQPITDDVIKEAIFSIDSDKAPGREGFNVGFFKLAWPVVGGEITAAILEVFHSGKLLKQLNGTLITLVPKVQLPIAVGDFRPI